MRAKIFSAAVAALLISASAAQATEQKDEAIKAGGAVAAGAAVGGGAFALVGTGGLAIAGTAVTIGLAPFVAVGAVVGLADIAHQAADGTADDDRAVGLSQVPDAGFAEIVRARQIGRDDRIPVLVRHSHGQAIPGDAGIVHQDVQLLVVRFDGLVDDLLDPRRVGHAGQTEADFGVVRRRDFGRGLFDSRIEVHQHQMTLLLSELFRNGPADSSARARDENDLAFQVRKHCHRLGQFCSHFAFRKLNG